MASMLVASMKDESTMRVPSMCVSAVGSSAQQPMKMSSKKNANNNQLKRSSNGENTGRWTKEEHETFLDGLNLYGKEWKKIAGMVSSRTVVQIRTHAQKYFQKIAKTRESQGKEVPGDLMSTANPQRGMPSDNPRKQRVSSMASKGSNLHSGSNKALSLRRSPKKSSAMVSHLAGAGSHNTRYMNGSSTTAGATFNRRFDKKYTKKHLATTAGKNGSKAAGASKLNIKSSDGVARVASSKGKMSSINISSCDPTKEDDLFDLDSDATSNILSIVSPRAGGAASNDSQQRLKISTALTHSFSEETIKSRDEEDLKWLVSGMMGGSASNSSKLPDASPTAVSDFVFYRDFGGSVADDIFPMGSTVEDADSDRELSDQADSNIQEDMDLMEEDLSELCNSEWISGTDEGSGIDGNEADLLSDTDPSQERLEPQPELAEIGPLTTFVFGEDSITMGASPPMRKRRKKSIDAEHEP
mmetsp:Transcript_20709/g.34174  ORF Transcript_20709/g.34174 Transcript_20709/m.34174 type:complete len:471 (-) Transcript_20709:82-1494(-)|eukprot:CAMPEP_0203748396 /NCGR_PEP_ID=MMETSP0098-20131031/3267_1 /ASSEMBLY_ACC=CAM_ASM_000208 /TAXON_ID=96639 /ORGANISM=" , Strain NY0313808BC1" /LENGTH=470 /DNA_ID=CAMNT_0050637123 /DNA_START=733 /DNA_END=2145 /DNA_ORIENTATION=+